VDGSPAARFLAQASGSTFLELPAGQTPGLKAPVSMLMRLGRTSGDSVEVWTHDDFAEVGAAGEEILACPQEVLHDAGRTPHGTSICGSARRSTAISGTVEWRHAGPRLPARSHCLLRFAPAGGRLV